ncbi:MAG TPA: ribonuclease HIII [Gemmatimonadales bacterium]
MNRDARELDRLVRDWWMEGASESRLSAILDLSVGGQSNSVVPLARSLSILEQANLPHSLLQRVDKLRERIVQLLKRTRQIDALGDLDNEPEVLFAILGDETLAIEGFDSDRIQKARLMHQGSRASAAEALLQSIEWGGFDPELRGGLERAIADLKDRERFESWGLFIDGQHNVGVALGINFVVQEDGQQVLDDATNEIRKQAAVVSRHFLNGLNWEMSIEWPATFAGESIGVPLSIAALVARGEVTRDPLLCATGQIDLSGNVLGVAGIPEKIDAARRLGMRRVVVPKENVTDAIAAAQDDLVVIPIAHVQELTLALRQSVSAIDFDFTALTRLVRASVHDYGLHITEERTYPHGLCFVVGNTSGKVSLWVYTNGRVQAQGSSGPSLEAATKLIQDRVPADPEVRPTQSFDMVTTEFREKSRLALVQVGACDDAVHENELWRLRLKRGRSIATVMSYASGKCVLQGTAPAWQVAFDTLNTALSPVGGLQRSDSRAQTTGPAVVDSSQPHIGTDEAGKGDYFGPLVSAAVYVDKPLAHQFHTIGVRDSKKLSDRRVKEVAEAIRQVAEGKYAVTPIHPARFNQLYAQFSKEQKNLNSLLAWGHAKSIDRLLSAPASRNIRPMYVLVDQFADPRHVEERTRRAGIPIHQRPKAEDDIAVAAASVLARDAFLDWLEKWSTKVGMRLPKGASAEVIAAGKQFVKRWGRELLADVAKLSFKTTKQVLEGEEEGVTISAPPWAADRDSASDS